MGFYWEAVVTVIVILLLQSQFSATIETRVPLEMERGGDDGDLSTLQPCLAELSVIYKGNCVQCLSSSGVVVSSAIIGVGSACSPSQNTSSTTHAVPKGDHTGATMISNDCLADGMVLLCPPVGVDPETFKIAQGKRFLAGRVLRVVTIERHPFVKVMKDGFTGVIFELLNSIEEKFNFSATVFLPYDGNWGARTANGSWNGMIGQVIRNEADIGAAGFSVTLERAKVIDFSMSYHQEPSALLIPAPKSGNKLAILVRPLSPQVWLAVFTTIGVLVPSLFVMHIVSLRLRENRGDPPPKPVKPLRLIGDLLQFIVGSLVQESLMSPVNKTTRFLVVIWWFLTLVVSNIYLGYMVSFLSAPKLFDIVDSLDGLVKQRELEWTYRKSTALADLFQLSTSGVYKAIGLGVTQAELVTSDQAGVDKVLTGKFAFIKEKSYLDVALSVDFDKTQTCRLTVAKETFFTVGFAFIVRKGSVFLELLDREILNTVTTGLMEKWKALHWARSLFCVDAASYIIKTQPKTRKLATDDFQGAAFLLMCGLSAAILSFIVETRHVYQSMFKVLLNRPAITLSGSNNVKDFKIIVIPVQDEYFRKMSLLESSTKKGLKLHRF